VSKGIVRVLVIEMARFLFDIFAEKSNRRSFDFAVLLALRFVVSHPSLEKSEGWGTQLH
jgi:hypothetical protein